MAGIQTSIELQDNFTGILHQVINSVNLGLSAMEDLHSSMNAPVDMASIDGARDSINQAAMAVQELDAAMQGLEEPDLSQNSAQVTIPIQAEPVEVPVHWQTDNLEVFTNTGIERFELEVQSANNMLETLNQTQQQIAQTAAQTDLFPSDAIADIDNMQNRLQAVTERIQQIESNPLNLGTDTANAELEQLRAQLEQAVQAQEELNSAVENMDVQAANDAYLRLSQTVSSTERYIRDNVDEQGRFNDAIEDGADEANKLMQTIKNAVGAYLGISGLKKAFDFIQDCTQAFNTQLNAETQLISVLANTLDKDYVSKFEIETAADTTGAIDEINSIQDSIDEVVVPVTAEAKALTAAFDDITAKAAEIQGRGIYGDEAMIAAAAEFSTYFSDTEAIKMMMDTLADYAMGMTGGGEIGSKEMVDYATNLGKIMSGAYDAMTKKGFEFTEAQEAIIEGTATHEQIVAELGEEYLNVSSDMQAAAAITSIIDESWAGLYETMSNTPEGKIIQMNNALGDMKEIVGKELYPYVILFVDAVNNNWGTIEAVIQGITTGLKYMLGVLSWIVEGAFKVASVIVDNWSVIRPIIYGVIGALTVYGAYLAITKGIELASAAIKGIMAIWEGIHAAAIWATTSATWAEVTAQNGLNAAMYACPIVWIIILIIALIAVFYLVIAVINKVCDTQISATGIIIGTLAAIGAFFFNVIAILWNIISAFIEFFVNVWYHPEYAVKAFLVNITNAFLGFFMAIIKGHAAAIGEMFGKWCAFGQSILNWLVDIRNNFNTALAHIKYNWEMKFYKIQCGFHSFVDFVLRAAQSVADGMGSAAQGIADVFVSAANIAIGAINGIIDILNMLPGVNINSPFSFIDPESVSDISDKIAAAREEWSKSKPIEPEFVEPEHIEYTATVEEMYNAGKQIGEEWATGIEGTIESLQAEMQNWLGEKPEDYWEAPKLDYINIGDAAISGYNLGERIANIDPSSLFGTTDIPSPKDFANSLAGGVGNGIDDIADNTGGAADSAQKMADKVKDIADDMDVLDDELDYLRDIAERDTINRFTTAEIRVEMNNNNNISKDADIDGIVDALTYKLYHEMNAVAEGVHI